MKRSLYFLKEKFILLGLGLCSMPLVAQDKGFNDDTFTTILSKKFDFEDTAIDGQAATPTGFMLRGRNSQSLSQLVTLRKDFSERLKSSSEGAKVVSSGSSD